MKKYFILILFVGLGLGAVNITGFAASPKKIDKIKVIINNEVITESELAAKITKIKQHIATAHQSIPENYDLTKSILENIIDTTLQMQLATKVGLTVPDAEVDAAIADIAKKNNISLAKLKEALAKDHVDFASFRSQIHDEMIIARLQEQFLGKEISVSANEVAALLQEHPTLPAENDSRNPVYQLKDLLISLPEKINATQLPKIKAEVSALLSKADHDLNKIAAYFSGKLKVKINDLGVRRLADLPDIFANELKKPLTSDLIGPIEAPNGIHVLKIVASRGAAKEIKLTKEQAQQIVWRKKMETKLKEWLKELRTKAYIKINE